MGTTKQAWQASRQARESGSLSTAGWSIFWNIAATTSIGMNFLVAGVRFAEGKPAAGWLSIGIIVLLFVVWSWAWLLQWYNTYNAGIMSVYRERRDKHFEGTHSLVSRSMGGR